MTILPNTNFISMTESLEAIIIDAIDELKGKDITVLNVSELTSITDQFIIVTGHSSRHVKSIADNIMLNTKQKGIAALHHEGIEAMDWVVIDYGDSVVHVMQEATRELYDLESLWRLPAANLST